MIRIADTFTDALARLTHDEQKAVKTTVFDLQVNPASPGLSFDRHDRARDRNLVRPRLFRCAANRTSRRRLHPRLLRQSP